MGLQIEERGTCAEWLISNCVRTAHPLGRGIRSLGSFSTTDRAFSARWGRILALKVCVESLEFVFSRVTRNLSAAKSAELDTMPSRMNSMIFFISILTLLAVGVVGCGSEIEFDPNESETSRAIRAKVRADMEKERLARLAPRLEASLNATKSAPTATGVVLAKADTEETAGADEEASSMANLTPFEVGSRVYANSCSNCHGPRGAGDGPVGASLVPQPAKHNDGVYMNALSNDYLFKVIKEGGGAVGKSPMMAAWGGTLSDDEIRGTVVFLRSLAEPAYEGELP